MKLVIKHHIFEKQKIFSDLFSSARSEMVLFLGSHQFIKNLKILLDSYSQVHKTHAQTLIQLKLHWDMLIINL